MEERIHVGSVIIVVLPAGTYTACTYNSEYGRIPV